jgi:putative ABC transport system permease protein
MAGRSLAREAGIEKLIILPWGKAVQMSTNSIVVRLGRSVITASGIFLGIAFLVAVLTSSSVLSSPSLRDLPGGGIDAAARVRNVWLVVVSLLVATVGIANAMLMAVTERYKEIGTMKCLGALDAFVVRLFLLESLMLGLLGSVTGGAVGFGSMALIYMARFGVAPFKHLGPAMQIGGWPMQLWEGGLVAVLLGGLLSVFAALYPAWRAAKMPPAAALRTEI